MKLIKSYKGVKKTIKVPVIKLSIILINNLIKILDLLNDINKLSYSIIIYNTLWAIVSTKKLRGSNMEFLVFTFELSGWNMKFLVFLFLVNVFLLVWCLFY